MATTSTLRAIPMSQQDATARKILAIRAAALGVTVEELAKLPCPSCYKPADRPFRDRSPFEAKIFLGCIDAHHHGHLVPMSNSSAWHTRLQAAEMRRATLKHMESL